MLGVGIAATVTVFSAVEAIAIRPLPYDDAGRLFVVRETRPSVDFVRTKVSVGEFLQWIDRRELFESVTAIDYPSVTVASNNVEPETLTALVAPASLFDLLRLQPALGRVIVASDDTPGQPLSVLIAWDYWHRRFNGDSAVLGREIRVDRRPATIVGVLPQRVSFATPVDIVLPAQYGASDAAAFDDHFLDVVARLRRDVTPRQAERVLSTFVRGQQTALAHANGVTLVPLRDEIVGATSKSAWLLFGAVACVLATACANIANLLLARATTRKREIAIRAVLGASRTRIAGQLVTESLFMSLVGGALGILLSLWGIDLVAALGPSGTPRLNEVRFDAVVLAFSIALTLATGVIFGLAPAIHASRIDLNDTLKVEGRTGTSSRYRTLRALATAEVAVALTLLIGAALLAGSFRRLTTVDVGFEADRVLTLNVVPPDTAYANVGRQTDLYNRLLDRVSRVPQIESVALVNVLPLGGSNNSGGFAIEGRPAPAPSARPNANLRSVTPAYFRTMGIPIVRGRSLRQSDTASAPPVAVINQTMARRFWPNEDPIGKRIKRGRAESATAWVTIVGIVGDVHHRSLRDEARQEIYFPFAQRPERIMVLTARTAVDPALLVAPLRAAVGEVDPDITTDALTTMREVVAAALDADRFSTGLVSVFAVTALVLAVVGIYGVSAFAVSQRRRELGVRVALGARRLDVVGLVLRQALELVAIGSIVGIAGALALRRTVASMLFGVSVTDPRAYTVALFALVVAAACAIAAPVYRATRVDPVAALRD